MDIYLYRRVKAEDNISDADYILVGVVSDFVSCSFTRSWNGVGKWEIAMSNYSENLEKFKEADFIKIHDKAAGIINTTSTVVNEDEEITTFSGEELKGIAYMRIIDPRNTQGIITDNTYTNKSIGYLVHDLLYSQLAFPTLAIRKIPINIHSVSGGKLLTYNPVYDNLGDKIEELSKSYSFGWYAAIEDAAIHFYAPIYGEDRTTAAETQDKLILSFEHNTILSSEYEQVKYLPNTAYVAGQGIGKDREIAVYNDVEYTGLDRYETLVDARDINIASELPQRGQEQLSQYGTNNYYICEATQALQERYMDTFDLGDLGTIIDTKTNIQMDVRIQEITEVYDNDGSFHLELMFGKDIHTLQDNLTILESKTTGLLRAEPGFYSTTDGTYNFLRYWLGVRDGLYPKIKFWSSKEDDASIISGEQSIEGSFYHCISMQAWNERNNSNNRRALYLYDSDGKGEVAYSLILSEWKNNVQTDYTLLHTGNLSEIIKNNNLNTLTTESQIKILNGNMVVDKGYIYTKEGTVGTWNGDVYTSLGNIFTVKGDIYTSEGDIYCTNGNLLLNTGHLSIQDGYINLVKGNITTELGDIYSKKGTIGTYEGDVYTSKGDITTYEGDISASNGNISASGSISGKTLKATSSITGASLTVTGAIKGKTVNGTTSITSPSITATTSLKTKALTVENTEYPETLFKTTKTATEKYQRIAGAYTGYITIQASADAGGTEMNGIYLYDPDNRADVDNALVLKNISGGVSAEYNILHSGNVGNYADSFSPSSVSSAITWDTDYVDTASGKTAYVVYKLGKIRLVRVKIVLKEALTATTVIGTMKSGNRPCMTIYGTVNQLTGTTTDVRTLAFASGGNISMYNNTKASTYYGTIVYFCS